jgi:predicted AAA+ superfamily ATPase
MVLKRFAEKRLIDWLKEPQRKPLVIRGARQVGKSTLVRQFAENQGLILHEVNLERHLTLTNIFKSQNIPRILKELEFICGKGRIDQSGSLLFLDEIQAIPVAIQTLRYFYEDFPDLPVLSAGSLLEFALAKHSFSMPVGRIEYLFLGPLTFEETLDAMNEKHLLNLIREYRLIDVFPLSAHERLLEIQRLYFLVGGMPEAVQRFTKNNDLNEAFNVHTSIVETYRDDFSKYASQADLLRIHKVFEYVPLAVGHKIKYASIDKNEQARDLGRSIDLLTNAQVIMKVFHTDASGFPIRATIRTRIFKPFFLDCGLMNTMCGVQWISPDELNTDDFINKGKVSEQFIAQHLPYLGKNNARPVLTYWLREGRSSNAEVDFVLQVGQFIVPIEVKAGKSGTLKSILQFVFQKKTPVAVRFDLNPPSIQHVAHSLKQSSETAKVSFDLISLPLYMIEELPRIFMDYTSER